MAEQILLKPKGIKQNLENFWYHYKLHTIAVLFLIAMLAVGITQCATGEKADYKVIICMDKFVPDGVIQSFKEQLAQYGEDLNGDGKVTVAIIDTSIAPNERNSQIMGSQSAKLQAELHMGETMLFITDQTKFDMLDELKVFETTDYLPDCGGKAVNLNHTDFAEKINLAYENFISHDVYISKRLVKGTDFEKNAVSATNDKNAAALLKRLVASIKLTSSEN